MRIRLFVLMVGVAMVASACSTSSTNLDGTWTVVEIAQADGTMVPPEPGTSPTLTIDETGISGSAGCNSYNASGDWPSDDLLIASTLMACEPSVMQQEAMFLAHLSSAESASVDGSTLTVSDADGNVTLVLVQQPK